MQSNFIEMKEFEVSQNAGKNGPNKCGPKSLKTQNHGLGPFSGRNKWYQMSLATQNNEITILHHHQSLYHHY